MLRHAHHGWFDVERLLGVIDDNAVAADEYFPALFLGCFEGFLHAVECALVDKRADEDGLIAWIADGERLVGGDDLVHQLIRNGFVHDETAHGGAALASGTGSSEDNAAQS